MKGVDDKLHALSKYEASKEPQNNLLLYNDKIKKVLNGTNPSIAKPL